MKVVPLSSLLAEQPRNGWSPPAEFHSRTGTPVLTLSSVTGFEYDGTKVKMSSAPTQPRAHYWLQTGELLVSRSNTQALVGHAAIYDGTPNRAICCDLIMKMRVDPKKALTKFIHYYFQSPKARKYLTSQARGANATMSKIGKQTVQDLPIPIPTITEQRRIVSILDETLESLATAQINAERNLRNARLLFGSHLHAVFTHRGKGWLNTRLGDEVALLAGFAFKSGHYTDLETGVKLLRGDNIVQGSLRWNDVKRWPIEDFPVYGRYQLRPGDVVLAMDRPWIKAGLKHAMITSEDLPCLLVQRTARLRCGPNIDNQFLLYLIRSEEFARHILGVQTGSGVPHISGQQIEDYSFARPALAEQRAIAAALEDLRLEVQNLTAIHHQKLVALETLRKSLLHQAFTGQL